MLEGEVIRNNNGSFESSKDNITEELNWVKVQIKKELNNLQKEVEGGIAKDTFFKKEGNNVVYDIDLLKNFLGSCIQKDKLEINSAVVMAVQIALETLGNLEYDVGKIDGLLKTNSGKISKTESVIRKFQRDNGLKKVDGIPGKETIGKILEYLEANTIPEDTTVEVTEETDMKKFLYALEIYNGRVLTPDFRQQIEMDGYDVKELQTLAQDRNKMENLNRLYPARNKGQRSESINVEQYKEELKQVNDVIKLINSLPEASAVTLNDENQINDAQTAYDHLNENQKEKVTNIGKLTNVKDALNTLKQNERQNETETQANEVTTTPEVVVTANEVTPEVVTIPKVAINNNEELENTISNSEARVKNVIDLIKEIPAENEITIDDENTIMAAFDAYNLLDDSQTSNMDLYEQLRLLRAREKISEIKVQNVENLINDLPDIKNTNIGDLQQAYNAKREFDALNENEKTKVNNKDKLNNIVSKIEELNNNNILLHPLANQEHYGLKMNNIENVKGTDILKNADKLKAKTPNEVGGLGNSILDGIERYANIKFPNIDGISGKETTSHKNRFKSEEDVINYKNEHPDIKSFVLYFGGNTSNNDQTFNDIEKWAGWLSGQGIEPVLCTSIGVDLPKHTSKTNYRQYNGKRLVDLNARIRQLAQDHGYPLIDYALIDDNIKIGSDGVHPTSYNLMNRMLDDCLDK